MSAREGALSGPMAGRLARTFAGAWAQPWAGPVALLALLSLVSMYRPLLPVDETRYAAVAWEMWTRGDFLVPTLNGQPYHHKPPLLFWLMQAGWAVFGVNEWWPRLLSPLFGAGTLVLTARLGQALWPDQPEVARIAPGVLVSSVLFSYLATALMFDALLSFFVALGYLGLVRAWRGGAHGGGFAMLALALAGSLLAKGPVALLHLAPPVLLAPWWMRAQPVRWPRWYRASAVALLAGAAPVLAWALAASAQAGESFRQALFWGQTAGRMVSSFAHAAPWWFYAASMPFLLAPWFLWPRWWKGLRRLSSDDSGLRLVVSTMAVVLVAFSLISGKRWQYLLPQVPLFALLVARACAQAAAPRYPPALATASSNHRQPRAGVRRLATATVLVMALLLAVLALVLREPYDVSRVGQHLARFEAEGRPVAINTAYQGQWTLAGRLRQPLADVPKERLGDWLAGHPQGRVVYLHREGEALPAGSVAEYAAPWRGGRLAILAPR